jgi:hypothetical protein
VSHSKFIELLKDFNTIRVFGLDNPELHDAVNKIDAELSKEEVIEKLRDINISRTNLSEVIAGIPSLNRLLGDYFSYDTRLIYDAWQRFREHTGADWTMIPGSMLGAGAIMASTDKTWLRIAASPFVGIALCAARNKLIKESPPPQISFPELQGRVGSFMGYGFKESIDTIKPFYKSLKNIALTCKDPLSSFIKPKELNPEIFKHIFGKETPEVSKIAVMIKDIQSGLTYRQIGKYTKIIEDERKKKNSEIGDQAFGR